MSNFLSANAIDQLSLKFSGFDFKSAMNDILEWQDELGTDYDDEVAFTVLEGVLDILIDRSTF